MTRFEFQVTVRAWIGIRAADCKGCVVGLGLGQSRITTRSTIFKLFWFSCMRVHSSESGTLPTFDIECRTFDIGILRYCIWNVRYRALVNELRCWDTILHPTRTSGFSVLPGTTSYVYVRCRTYTLLVRHRTSDVRYRVQHCTYDIVRHGTSGTCRKFLPVIYLSYACHMTSQFIFLSYIKYMTRIYFPTKLMLLSFRVDV